ncbi:hypothetical protein N9V49_03515 [Flavobacteriaceae bacterium]|nr:hypothetical protein [Flavobacteriaceae bacterium]
MKKGLLTVLLASLVLVGCQNYDDQFDDLNAQISALKSQVDGLSSLTGQVSSLSGSISGLSAGVAAAQAAATAAGTSADAATAAANGIDLTGLSASLATLQAEVDAVQASLATAATATAVAALQTELDAIEADVDELLATSNVYNTSLTISSASTLDAAVALGNNINIVNGSVTITQSSTMDATKLQTVIDKIFTVTGNFSYTAANTNVTAQTFDKLASAGDVTLKVNGPISAKTLVTAGTVTLDDSYISKVTSINLDMLTTVTEIQTDSGGTDNIVFTSATDVQLGALASYPGAGSDYGLTITTKADATLDIGSLDDVKTDGTAAPVALTLNGPKDISITNMSAYAGSLSLTNIENATVTGFKGPITINGGVENITITDAEDFTLSSATGLKTVTLDVDKASDPALTATQKAPSAYGAQPTAGYTNGTPALSFASMSNLTSVTLTGFYKSVTFTSLANLATVDMDVTTGDLTMSGNNSLTSLDVTGSEIGNVSITSNTGISTVELDHTTDLNFYGTTADRTSVSLTVTGNSELTSLTSSADKIMTLAVNDNDKLTTVNFAGLATFGTASTSVNPVVDVYDNDLTASQASDTDDGLTQYAIGSGATSDAADLGSYTTTSGLNTLKTYLQAVDDNAKADAAVHFDTVSLHNIAADAATSSETAGDQNSGNAVTYSTEKANDVTLVYANTASTEVTTTTGNNVAVKAKNAWLLDVSSSATLVLDIETIDVLETNGTFGTFTLTGNNTLDVAELTSSLSTTRAANLGVTLTAAATGNPVLPNVQFLASISSATGSNGENYTNTEAANLSLNTSGAGAAVASYLTTYDAFTMSFGGRSVTATLAATATAGGAAAANIASTLMNAWNSKWSTGQASTAMSAWTTATLSTALVTAPTLKSSKSGGRFYGDSAAITWTPATATQASYASAGSVTITRIAWKIGATEATTDNTTTGTDIIITVEETVAGSGAADRLGASGNVTLTVDGMVVPTIENVISNSFGLLTDLISVGASAAETDTSANIYADDARGDVVTGVSAADGTTATTGSAQSEISRLHWLG